MEQEIFYNVWHGAGHTWTNFAFDQNTLGQNPKNPDKLTKQQAEKLREYCIRNTNHMNTGRYEVRPIPGSGCQHDCCKKK